MTANKAAFIRYLLRNDLLSFYVSRMVSILAPKGTATKSPTKTLSVRRRSKMRFQKFSFGSIRIDGVTYQHDVVIDRGDVRKRKKKPSKKFRDEFGHTPVSIEERIPWRCRSLIVGTGTGALPVMDDVKSEAKRRKITLLVLP